MVTVFLPKLTGRERSFVGVGAVVLLSLVTYLGLYTPLRNSLRYYTQEVASKKEQLVWMNKAAADVVLLGGGKGRVSYLENGEIPLTLLNETAKQNKLLKAIKQIQPDGKAKVRLSLNLANFSDLINWVQLLEEKGISISHLSVERLESPGLVNAKLTLESIQVK